MEHHYSLIIIVGCLTYWFTQCMSFWCYGGLLSVSFSSFTFPLKLHSKSNFYGFAPLLLNTTYSCQRLLEVTTLISEVIEKEMGTLPRQFARSNLPCVGELFWAIIQMNIDQLTLKNVRCARCSVSFLCMSGKFIQYQIWQVYEWKLDVIVFHCI